MSSVHINPNKGAVFLLAISQCSLKRYKGKASVMFSLPNPIASFPSFPTLKPPCAVSFLPKLNTAESKKLSEVIKVGMISLITNFVGSALAASDLPTSKQRHMQSPSSRASIVLKHDKGQGPSISTIYLY